MRQALLIVVVLSLSALALAGPFDKNEIDANKAYQQYGKATEATQILEKWCFSSQMSQPEMTASFKRLVAALKTSPGDKSTEAAVMGERICRGTIVPKSNSIENTNTDANAHELIKDVYMDALISCDARECNKQLMNIIESEQVDTIRASYYMTRIAVSESSNSDSDAKQLAESFISESSKTTSEAVSRQKLFAVTALLSKAIEGKKEHNQDMSELKQLASQVAKTIVERYVKPVSQSEVQQYQQQHPQQQSWQQSKKIAQRSAALKALTNIPGSVLAKNQEVEQTLIQIAQCKEEMSTARQTAIECLEFNDSPQAVKTLKQLTYDQQEPIEVRVAAYRSLMTVTYAGQKDASAKQQMAAEIIDEVVKHCERNQQQDDQFVMYVISHLDNLRTSQQPEYQAIKECINKNKQHSMQIHLLTKKFNQVSDIRKSSRNYKLGQEFDKIESGIIVEGDIVYESKHNQQQQNKIQLLPKVIRVNMSMPVMGETVNVMEVTLRQNAMDEELLGALKLVQATKFNSETLGKAVDSFKSATGMGKQQQESAEADLTIKVEGCTIMYMCADDVKASTGSQHQRKTRSANSLVDEIIEHLKRKPVAFNRGFNFNVNERLAKMLDIEANVIAGLRFESRASGQTGKDFEIAAQIEPRFAFEAIVGPAKVSSKKLLQRVSTKTAIGMRLRYKSDELVDVQIDLPQNTMDLFTIETQMVEKSGNTNLPYTSYTYLPESIYGQEDIYTPYEDFYGDDDYSSSSYNSARKSNLASRKIKRSAFFEKKSTGKSIVKLLQGKQSTFAYSLETSEKVARSTGLRGKLRVVASPKDMSLLVQAVAQKYEAGMQGYRVQVQKAQRGSEQKQWIVTVSTPGSRIERTMQVRLAEQSNSQRTIVKAEVQSPKMSYTVQYELVHDGRQYAVKAEIACNKGGQWRHSAEMGVQRGSQSQSGRIASTYKPYMSIDSTSLKRPVQMQGAISYQQSPNTVINYELKCPTTGDYVQGKFILDERSSSGYGFGKRAGSTRRSMRSPIENLFQNDYTLTGELVGQVSDSTIVAHKMIDWSSAKQAVQAELKVAHKSQQRKTTELSASLKLDKDQQVLTVQRETSPQQDRKDYRLTIASDCKSSNAHQLVAEYRYNGQRNSIAAYKHKVDFTQLSSKKVQIGYVIELVASERELNEKLAGRAQLGWERKMKTLKGEMSGHGKSAKVDVEFVSFGEHQIDVVFQGERVNQRTTVRADSHQFQIQSRTDNKNQLVAKINLNVQKQEDEAQLTVEVPSEGVHAAVDLKLASGKLSSVAIKTPRFASKAEFAFDKVTSGRSKRISSWKQPFLAAFPTTNLRFKTDLKDLANKQSYWMESALNGDWNDKSYFRYNTPIYHTDLEFDPSVQQARFGAFARSKRSIGDYEQLYSNEESLLNQLDNKLNLGNKLWMMRSIVSSPSKMDEIKQKARQALFEYADRRQNHRHSINYDPSEERVKFDFDRQPSSEFSSGYGSPMRFTGDFAPKPSSWFGTSSSRGQMRPSSLNMESDYVDFDFSAKPFDGEESYARFNALSRHPRSAFKSHKSEIRYNKDSGYKASMKHQDSQDRRHSFEAEADQSPKKWAKMSYDSDKHGKGKWEHKWRQQQNDDSDYYQTKAELSYERPSEMWSHRSQFSLNEPTQSYWNKQKEQHRLRRDIGSELAQVSSEAQRRYNTIDYLKHLSARYNCQTSRNNAELYDVDFDFQPRSHARLNVNMPEEDLLHSSSIEYEPTERLYKMQSKLFNRRTNQPSYELYASTKPIITAAGLATADQEPLFIEQQHSMLDYPLTSGLSSLFKQPLKLDYSDKYGRIARVNYGQSPVLGNKYAGLRQKRAALYYKDNKAQFEHKADYDFYPEAVFGLKPSKRVPGDFSVKAQTKYGPVVVHTDSADNGIQMQIQSPVFNAKMSAERSSSGMKRSSGATIFKFAIDNKQQTVQLNKIVRNYPILKDCSLVQDLVKSIDQGRFEHQCELLVSHEDGISKIKSQTYMNKRPVLIVDGELNEQLEKLIVKINAGERTDAQLLLDLVSKSANLAVNVNNKRTLQHQTRLVRVSEKFFALESMTYYKQQPMLKLNGKVSSMILSEPAHLFSRRRSGASSEEHISSFEAMLYEPRPYQVTGQYDCLKKEARVAFKDLQSKRVQLSTIKYDDQTETIYMEARLASPYGQVYSTQAKLGLAAFMDHYKCRSSSQSCQSELVYSGKGGAYSAKYVPGKYVSMNSPYGQQSVDLSVY